MKTGSINFFYASTLPEGLVLLSASPLIAAMRFQGLFILYGSIRTNTRMVRDRFSLGESGRRNVNLCCSR